MALTPKEIFAYARQAGFSYAEAQTATAIALAESGGEPNELGDEHLTGVIWGPSVGLMQIRSLRSHNGTGKERDALRLKDPLFNMRAAVKISSGGINWIPWTVYREGTYKKHMAAAIGAGLVNDPTIPNLVVEEPQSTLETAKSAIGLIGKAGAWMSDSHNWARVALVVGGSAGLLVGLTMLAKAGAGPASAAAGAPAAAVKAASKIIPAGKAAGAVAKAAKAATK